ncbi:sugar nucleotide-binding protein [Niallia sp. JL1B1071]|uniref:sugar nucleotide-binding protein n=1 Tax=Niallia tiangongensis TaxID=3237105 RepID=UPI0037DC77F9
MDFSVRPLNPNYYVCSTSRSNNACTNILQLDIRNKHQVTQLVNHIDPDVVIWSLMDGEKENHLIEVGLNHLLSAISKETKLIYLSTDAIFVDGKGNYAETDQPGFLPSEAPLSTYVNAKHFGEDLILANHANHVLIRTGPLYGEDANHMIETRTQRIIHEINTNGYANAAADTFKSFVHIDDLAKAIIEMIEMDFTGIIHVGPKQKESYYSFYLKRLSQIGFDSTNLFPFNISKFENPYHSFDTSLNTQKATSLLSTHFRNMDEPNGIKKDEL